VNHDVNAVVARMSHHLDGILDNATGADDIPLIAYPPVALKLNELLSDEDYGMRDIAEIISADAAIAATVLRYANSVKYAAADEITRLDVAISRIGVQGVVNLVFASGLAGQFNHPGLLLTLRHDVWRRALFAAFVSRQLGHGRGEASDAKTDQEVAFIATLLRSIGPILVVGAMEQILKADKNAPSLPEQLWATLVEKYGRAFGAMAANSWSLPQVYRGLIVDDAGVDDPGDQSDEASPLARICRHSEQISSLIDRHIVISGQIFQNELGLNEADSEAVIQTVWSIPAWVHTLGLPSPFKPGKSLVHSNHGAAETPALQKPVDSNISGSSASGNYALTSLDKTRMVATGKCYQQPGSLVQIILSHPRHRIETWAKVESSTKAQSQYALSLRPMLLREEQITTIDAIVSEDAAA
jgi:HD-like signal output (HDOD) protein